MVCDLGKDYETFILFLDFKLNLPQLLWIRALWKNVFDTVVSAIHQQKTFIIVRVIFYYLF